VHITFFKAIIIGLIWNESMQLFTSGGCKKPGQQSLILKEMEKMI